MWIGVTLVLTACFIWGLIFVIPQLLTGFSPFEVTLGRYFFFGATSLLVMPFGGLGRWLRIPLHIWKKAFVFSLVITIMYYGFVVLGMRYATPSVIALISGISPISVAFLGNWKQKICPFRQLIFPSLMIGLGLILVNIPALQHENYQDSPFMYGFGLLCGVFALAAWNWYMIANAQFFKDHPEFPSNDWSTLLGICALCWVFLIGSVLWSFASSEQTAKYFVWNEELQTFVFGCLALGFLCAWVGSCLWNLASKRLPVSLAGQLTIFETVFGLVFVYTFEQRYPSTLECFGIFVILTGVVVSLHVFNKAQQSATTTLLEVKD